MIAGLAFGILRDHPMYYWVCVPVIVLSGSIPVSPQGVGVMEGFAVLLLKPEGGTIVAGVRADDVYSDGSDFVEFDGWHIRIARRVSCAHGSGAGNDGG